MGKSLEDVFKAEFRNEVSNIGYKNIYKVPVPEVCNTWSVSGTELYAVKGIDAKYFNALNKTIVKRLPRGMVAKRRVLDKVNRGYKIDESGNYLYEDFNVPSGSIVVISEVKIDLPFSEYKKRISDGGYGYIDFVKYEGKPIQYMYVLPKSVLYRINQTALALSVKNMKNYSGSGYMTWDMGMIYLHIIPYKPNARYEGTRILKTGYTLNYSNEVNDILNFWQENRIIPNIMICALSDGSNLVTKGTVVGYDSYVPVESLALSDKEVYGVETETI